MAKKKGRKLDLDLNNDGKFDEKDKSIAAKVLASKLPEEGEELPTTKESEEVEGKEEGDRVCVKAISRTYREGSTVPAAQIARWKECGIEYEQWF